LVAASVPYDKFRPLTDGRRGQTIAFSIGHLFLQTVQSYWLTGGKRSTFLERQEAFPPSVIPTGNNRFPAPLFPQLEKMGEVSSIPN
jgi:hypothetical protein